MALDTHSEYVKIIAFPQQQWLLERASMLRYTYIAVLFNKAGCMKSVDRVTLHNHCNDLLNIKSKPLIR